MSFPSDRRVCPHPERDVGGIAPEYNEGPPMGDRRTFATKRYNDLI